MRELRAIRWFRMVRWRLGAPMMQKCSTCVSEDVKAVMKATRRREAGDEDEGGSRRTPSGARSTVRPLHDCAFRDHHLHNRHPSGQLTKHHQENGRVPPLPSSNTRPISVAETSTWSGVPSPGATSIHVRPGSGSRASLMGCWFSGWRTCLELGCFHGVNCLGRSW